MTVAFVGNLSVAASVPGLSAAFSTVGLALTDLDAVVSTQLGILASVVATLNGEVSALAAAKISIRLPAIADFQAQLDASLAISANLTAGIGNPSLYISGLLEGLAELQVTLPSLVPSVALSAQLDASIGVSLSMTAKIAAVDLALSVLVTIGAAISAAIRVVVAIQAALNVAIQAALSALNLFLSVTNAMAAGLGIKTFLYTGPLSNLGTEIDAAAVTFSGFAPSLPVRVPVLIYDGANAPALHGMQTVFGAGA